MFKALINWNVSFFGLYLALLNVDVFFTLIISKMTSIKSKR